MLRESVLSEAQTGPELRLVGDLAVWLIILAELLAFGIFF
jgi:hypothetical protein